MRSCTPQVPRPTVFQKFNHSAHALLLPDTGKSGLFESLRDAVCPAVSAEATEWKRSLGRTKNVHIDANWVAFDRDKLSANRETLLNRQYLHTFWTDCSVSRCQPSSETCSRTSKALEFLPLTCTYSPPPLGRFASVGEFRLMIRVSEPLAKCNVFQDSDEYRSTVKQDIMVWMADLKGKSQWDWFIVVVEDNSRKTPAKTTSKLLKSTVWDKIRNDFPSKNIDR